MSSDHAKSSADVSRAAENRPPPLPTPNESPMETSASAESLPNSSASSGVSRGAKNSSNSDSAAAAAAGGSGATEDPSSSSCTTPKKSSGFRGSARQQRNLRTRIRRIENHIRDISATIKKAYACELDLDLMSDEKSLFLQIERLQRRYLAFVNLLNDLRRESRKWERPIENRIIFAGTASILQRSGFDSIDRAITKFVNRSKSKFDQRKQINFSKTFYNFPSRNDILSIIRKENQRSDLNLSETAVDNLTKRLANDVFTCLKQRTVAERVQAIKDILPEAVAADDKDPALSDAELLEDLKKNKSCRDEINYATFKKTLDEIEQVEMPPLVQREVQKNAEDVATSSKEEPSVVQPMDSDDCPSVVTCILCFDKEKCMCAAEDCKPETEDDDRKSIIEMFVDSEFDNANPMTSGANANSSKFAANAADSSKFVTSAANSSKFVANSPTCASAANSSTFANASASKFVEANTPTFASANSLKFMANAAANKIASSPRKPPSVQIIELIDIADDSPEIEEIEIPDD